MNNTPTKKRTYDERFKREAVAGRKVALARS